ncbi:hypothetical protein HOI18_04565 [Candidatus Uhrbacteria bacterium]|jgi:hypothetical protein|nr:hypothetical protein [Candidatus Uhrbacteria bacterium]
MGKKFSKKQIEAMNSDREVAALVTVIVTILFTFMAASIQMSENTTTATSLGTYELVSLCVYLITQFMNVTKDNDVWLWNEILVRKGNPIARTILAICFAPGLLVSAAGYSVSWLIHMICRYAFFYPYLYSRDYKVEVLEAYHAVRVLKKNDADEDAIEAAKAQLWMWAKKKHVDIKSDLAEHNRLAAIEQANSTVDDLKHRSTAATEVDESAQARPQPPKVSQ